MDIASRIVYMAPVSANTEELSRKIRQELEMRGVGVLPAQGGLAQEHENDIGADLARASLSLHLFGGTEKSESLHAAEAISDALHAAIEYSRTHPRLQVLVWRPRTAGDSFGELPIVELIDMHPELSASTELIQSTVEDLKSMIYDKLESNDTHHHAVMRPASSGGNNVQLYLIYDQRDTETAEPVAKFLEQNDITVLPSIFEGEQTALRAMHNEYLRRCDAALIVYGKVREPWVRMKQQDLLRAAALGRRSRLAAKAVFLCSNNKDEKLHFSAPDMMVIKGFESTAALQSFVEQLGAAA